MTLTVAIGIAACVVGVGGAVGVVAAWLVLRARDPQRQVEFAATLERNRAASDAQAAIFTWFEGATRDTYDDWSLDRERVVHLAEHVRDFVKENGMRTEPGR